MKTYTRYIVATVFVGAIIIGSIGVVEKFRIAQTNETLAMVIFTASNYNQDLTNLENHVLFVEAIHRKCPEIPYSNNSLLDAWGRPIKIETNVEGNLFRIMVISSGPNGIFGSKSNIVKKDAFKIY